MVFQPGISGNPGGSQVKYQRVASEMLRLAVNSHDKAGKLKLRRICDKIAARAMAGEPWACCLVFDRLDGKAHQSIDQSVTLEAGAVFVDLLRAINDARHEKHQRTIEHDARKPVANGHSAPAQVAEAKPVSSPASKGAP